MHPELSENAPEDETTALARAVQAGDTSRFGALYQRLLPVLYAWAALRVPREKSSIEDFLQEVWFRAYRNLQSESAQRHPFRAWIFVIAKNCLLELLRARAPAPRSDLAVGPSTIARSQPDSTSSAATRLGQDETLANLLAFARTLDPVDRDLLVHCGFEGKPCTAVARQLDLTEDAAIKRWQRLRDRLRDLGWLRQLLSDD